MIFTFYILIMINKKFTQKLKEDYQKQGSERRQIVGLSNIVLHSSKRAIFSLHRDDVKRAEDLLSEVEKIYRN